MLVYFYVQQNYEMINRVITNECYTINKLFIPIILVLSIFKVTDPDEKEPLRGKCPRRYVLEFLIQYQHTLVHLREIKFNRIGLFLITNNLKRSDINGFVIS